MLLLHMRVSGGILAVRPSDMLVLVIGHLQPSFLVYWGSCTSVCISRHHTVWLLLLMRGWPLARAGGGALWLAGSAQLCIFGCAVTPPLYTSRLQVLLRVY